MEASELFDRYVHAVGGCLPKATRADVAAELRALLEDMAAERAAAGGPLDEAMAVAIVREFGRPEAVAERYGQPRPCLIGPAYYPAFKATTQVVVALVGLGYLLVSIWTVARGQLGPAEIGAALLEAAASFGGTALTNVGLIALVFAAIERAGPGASPPIEEDWDPRDLPARDDPDRIDRGDRAVELCFTLAALVVFNVVLRWESPFIHPGAPAGAAWARFMPELLVWVPWINTVWTLSAALDATILWSGRWRPLSRLADIALGGLSAYVLAGILAADRIVDVPAVSGLLRVGVAVLLAAVVVETARQLYRLVARPSATRRGPAAVDAFVRPPV